MKPWMSSVLVWTLGVMMVNCGARVREDDGNQTADALEAPPPLGTSAVATGAAPSQQPYDAPPMRFTAREHSPKSRYTEQAPPDLRRLPKLKMRMNKCFSERREEMKQIATPKPSVVKRKARSRTRSSMKSGAGMSKKAAAPNKGAALSSEAFAAAPATTGAVAEDMAEEAEAPPSMTKAAPMGEAAPMAEGADETAKIAIASPAPPPEPPPEPEPNPDDQYRDWGAATYLSNDDTMSLSSAQRVIYAIDNFLPLPASHIRPHELLNYFNFATAEVADGNDFSVLGDLEADPREPGIYNLGLSVSGRPVDKTSRRYAALTLVIDRSGSMSDEGRMSYLKQGLRRMLDELKTGDMLHVALFDHEVCVPAENFVVGRDDRRKIEALIDALEPRGSTDLHRGLSTGYAIADRAYQEKYSNRVVMITDALTNTGVTDQEMISMISKYYDTRRIRLSGVGVGRDFNDALLDRLTERGKGAYVFLGSEAEVDAVFGPRFISLIETTALDVHFRLHLPKSLRLNVFYGEESSTVKSDVQAIHYFANTSQLFYSDLMARGGAIRPQDGIMLTIEYKDPETEQPLVEEYAFGIDELLQENQNVRKARVIMAFVDLLSEMAARPSPGGFGRSAGSWQDPDGWERCSEGQALLTELSQTVASDPEVVRVNALLEKFCARYERPRNPVRRKIAAPKTGWPGAQPER